MEVATCAGTASQLVTIRAALFVSPHFHLIFFRALYSQFLHFLVVGNFRLRKFTVFAEYDVETQPDKADCD